MKPDRLVAWTVALGFLLVCYVDAKAETYVGIGGSLAIVDIETNCPECSTYDLQKTSVHPSLFVGYRSGLWALETGYGGASYRGHAVLPSRPADVYQGIDSRFGYLSVLRYVPLPEGEAFVGLGAARVWAGNHEHGLNRDTSTTEPAHQMDNLTYTKEIAPYFQVGYQYGPVRVGVSFIPNVVRSHWTGQQDIYNVSASYMFRF